MVYVIESNGGRGRDRTYDQSIKSRMLYQLSYASMFGVRPRGARGQTGCPFRLKLKATTRFHSEEDITDRLGFPGSR